MISHLITLDVELDASFKRAMPILEKKIPVEYHSSCKSILRVCAFTCIEFGFVYLFSFLFFFSFFNFAFFCGRVVICYFFFAVC